VSRPWRGNVRELRNFIERLRALGAADALALPTAESGHMGVAEVTQELAADASEPRASAGALPSSAALPNSNTSQATRSETGAAWAEPNASIFEQAYKDFREAWVDYGEKEYMRRVLDQNERNVATAAKKAGVDRTYIYRLIRKHEL
jgi:DNA-binding NtrC family response regulator